MGCFYGMHRRRDLLARIAVALLLLNIVSGMLDAAVYGDGDFARVEDGHYYLNRHGKSVEVSRAHYDLSRIQSATIIPSFVLLAVVGLWANRVRRKNKS
jgi:hypothetical protein